MLDPNKSALLERAAVFVVVAVLVDVWWALFLPYIAAKYAIQLPESDRAIIGQIVGAIINVLMLIVGFFFGTSVGRRQQEDTINKLATTSASTSAPIPDKKIPLAPGETAAVTAAPAAKPSTDGDAQ